MLENNKGQSVFSNEVIVNFTVFYNSLLTVRNRLLREGYSIENGKIFKPAGNFDKICYTPDKYDQNQPR
ncbi:MAG: hypothetical protein G01um101413_484 [Parcubacteria group bacterium Gr01-1014_13]|nr:MAG: hypothetical protein G01um101413_484 [Parcubacteria group bacterium Gr01-1014_13]